MFRLSNFHYRLCARIARTRFKIRCGLQVTGLQNVPGSGAIILAANHRSNWDPALIGSIVSRESYVFSQQDPRVGRGILHRLRSLNRFPIRRRSLDDWKFRTAHAALKKSLEVLADQKTLIYFLEGTFAPADGYRRAQCGIGWIVRRMPVRVIPVYIHGSALPRPRRRNGDPIQVVFGTPVSTEELTAGLNTGKQSYQIVADRILELIRELSLSTPGGAVRIKGSIYGGAVGIAHPNLEVGHLRGSIHHAQPKVIRRKHPVCG